MDLWDDLAAERLVIADRLDTLTPEQWQVRTLCPAWTVHQLTAHLVLPSEFSPLEMLTSLIRAGGRPERAMLIMVDRRATASPAALVQRLRDQAGSRDAPPFVGVLGPYTDALVHALDMWIPLGLDAGDRPVERWRPALDFLVSSKARMGFVPGPVPALSYRATDLGWRHGSGDVVSGPAAALVLALLGRTPWLDRLDGPGADTLRAFARRA